MTGTGTLTDKGAGTDKGTGTGTHMGAGGPPDAASGTTRADPARGLRGTGRGG
ncbi:MAG: hypothetical protein Kow0058_12530 [Roseovarius sp.]